MTLQSKMSANRELLKIIGFIEKNQEFCVVACDELSKICTMSGYGLIEVCV